MHIIAADTFAAAVAIGFQSRGEFGIGRPGPLLDMWLQQQSDEVVLSMVVDASTARDHKGLHEVLADIIGAAHGRRWGIRVTFSGYRHQMHSTDAPHWYIEASDVHAPAVTLADEASGNTGSIDDKVVVIAPCADECARADTVDQLRALLPAIGSII